MSLRPCLDCGDLVDNASRCPDCLKAQGKPTHRWGDRHNPVYSTKAWRTFRKNRIATHVRQNGWTCEGFERPPHPAQDLQVDHGTRLADGGSAIPNREDTHVYCQNCNIRASNAANRRKREAVA